MGMETVIDIFMSLMSLKLMSLMSLKKSLMTFLKGCLPGDLGEETDHLHVEGNIFAKYAAIDEYLL